MLSIPWTPILAFILLILLDIPWLYITRSASSRMFEAIQGSPIQMRMWAAIPVYIALAYLLLQQTSVLGAFTQGAAVYAVYDFTNLLVFKKYALSFALADTVWGGVLFATAHTILKNIRA